MLLVAGAATPRDFSILSLILHADIVVQCVMAGLALASVICWAIIFEKMFQMMRLGGQVREVEEAAVRGGFTGQERGPMARALTVAANAEAQEGAAVDETQNDKRARLEKAMRTAMKAELQKKEAGLPFLATTGSAAPFVGLFGTVWGIMNSFTAIAQSKDTSLAVVAPGIAEALFATALGLAAAIPAVIAYNQFVVGLGRKGETIGKSINIIAKKVARQSHTASRTEEAA